TFDPILATRPTPSAPTEDGKAGRTPIIESCRESASSLMGTMFRTGMILPTYEQGTWADQVVGINPATAYLLLNRYVSLMPGDWIGQTAANAAMGQYIIALAKLAGVKTLNLVRREEA